MIRNGFDAGQISGYIHRIRFNCTICSVFCTGGNGCIFTVDNFYRIRSNIIDNSLAGIGNVIQVSIRLITQLGIHGRLIVVIIVQIGIHGITGYGLIISSSNCTSADIIDCRFCSRIQSYCISDNAISVFCTACYGHFAACFSSQCCLGSADHIINMTICGSRICNSRLLGTGNSSFRSGSRLFYVADIGRIGICRSAAGYVGNLFIARIYAGFCNGRAVIDSDAVVVYHSISGFKRRCIDRIQPRKILGQLYSQRIVPVGNNPQIIISQLGYIRYAADNIRLFT